MNQKHFLFANATAIACGAALLGFTFATPQEKWVPLFNGKNLDGWTPKIKGYPAGENFGNTFRVERGVLKVSYDGYEGRFDGRFGHLFYKHPYSAYRLRFEYRFTGEQINGGPGWAWRNSGVMIHGQSIDSIRKDQDFPVSIEVQLLGGDGKGERTTGNMCSPGTNVVIDGKLVTQHCVNSKSKTFSGDQWVKLEIEVNGNGKIKHWINGDLVMEYEKPQLDENDPDGKALIKNGEKMLSGGTISLQSESHPVEFRNVELLELK